MRHYLLPLAFFFVAVTSAVAKDDITKELITSNGKTRAYYLYVPSTTKASAPVPLIVMLHGSGRVGMSLVGLELGQRLGGVVEKWSEEIGGAVLILVGAAIALRLF